MAEEQESSELSELEQELRRLVDRLSGRPRNCLRNAYRSIDKAYQLLGIDDEMAAFRSILAEEEAAAAIIAQTKRNNYPGSKELNFRNHLHKMSIYLFVSAVGDLINESPLKNTQLKLNKRTGRFDVCLDAKYVFGDLVPDKIMLPDEPLNFNFFGENGVYKFEKQLMRVSRIDKINNLEKFISDEANLRNKILYAGEEGIPGVSNVKPEINKRRWRVTVLSVLVHCINQTNLHQLFVSQSVALLVDFFRKKREYLDRIEDRSFGDTT